MTLVWRNFFGWVKLSPQLWSRNNECKNLGGTSGQWSGILKWILSLYLYSSLSLTIFWFSIFQVLWKLWFSENLSLRLAYKAQNLIYINVLILFMHSDCDRSPFMGGLSKNCIGESGDVSIKCPIIFCFCSFKILKRVCHTFAIKGR